MLRLGLVDAWPVICEPFRQWVIEDRFSDGRPRWEDVGAQRAEERRDHLVGEAADGEQRDGRVGVGRQADAAGSDHADRADDDAGQA